MLPFCRSVPFASGEVQTIALIGVTPSGHRSRSDCPLTLPHIDEFSGYPFSLCVPRPVLGEVSATVAL